MTNLTEQFNNDEIDESKLYYFKQKMSEEIEIGHPFSLNMVRAMDETYLDWFLIDSVLAPVPSYEEWERILVEKDSLKQIRDELDCAVTQLREDITDYKETIDEQERELSDSAFREDNLEKENAHLTEQLIQAKQAMSQALSYLACMDRISDTEPNEQLAFDVLRKCLEELENA